MAWQVQFGESPAGWPQRRHYQSAVDIQTVAHILPDVRALFSWAEDTDLIDRCPVRKHLLPRIQEQAPKALGEAEVAAVCSLPDPLGFTSRLEISLGLRWGELCRARVDYVENGMLVVARTKSAKLRRVPIPDQIPLPCAAGSAVSPRGRRHPGT